MTTGPEAIPADVLELAKEAHANFARSSVTDNVTTTIAHAILADRASPAPADGAEAKPVAWWIEANSEGASYFTRDSSLVGARKTSAEFTVTPLYTHPAPASPDAEMVQALVDSLRHSFITSQSDGSEDEYRLVAQFKTLLELQQAYAALMDLLSKHESDR